MLPGLLFLGVGSFKSTAGLQEYFTTGDGPKILMGFGIAALAWIAWQLITLLRTWQPTSVQPHGEPLAAHRFRIATALGGATTGLLLLYRGLGDAGPDGKAVPTLHLLDALDNFLVYLGFALLLLSLLALFPPGGLALAGVGVVGTATAEAATSAALIGTAGIVLMAAAGGRGAEGGHSSGGASGNKAGEKKPSEATKGKRKFEASPKHGRTQRGNAAPEPTHPQETLDDSLTFNPNTTRRVGVDRETGEFALFDETHNGTGIYHGHVRKWGELTQEMQSALRKSGLVTGKGKLKVSD
ncbi:hypothetical protein ACIQM0_23780 [Streptomyces sp. NPDC091387]|uniref:hypothetical protein n=1 Tax=Streptomyces sp. NPDC091387 TaxID=3365998 RepID=UPI003828969C